MERCNNKCRQLGIIRCNYCSSSFCGKCIQLDVHGCNSANAKIANLKSILVKTLGTHKPIRHGIDDT